MNTQLNKLKALKSKIMTMANRIDVNCEDSEKQYNELALLAREVNELISEAEAPK